MDLMEGTRFKSIRTGRVYEVKKIKDEWILLEQENRLSQVLTGMRGLKSLYELEKRETAPENQSAALAN